MTTRQLIDFYATCLGAACISAYYLGLIASISAFVIIAIAQTHYENIRRRP